MTTRDAIAEAIATGYSPADDDDAAAWEDDREALAGHIVNALTEAGYAVVKLPEPLPEDESPPGDVAAFDGANTVYFAIDGRVEDDSLNRWENLGDALDDAAALIAAVRHAEAVDE